jgi:hypothetical protein
MVSLVSSERKNLSGDSSGVARRACVRSLMASIVLGVAHREEAPASNSMGLTITPPSAYGDLLPLRRNDGDRVGPM